MTQHAGSTLPGAPLNACLRSPAPFYSHRACKDLGRADVCGIDGDRKAGYLRVMIARCAQFCATCARLTSCVSAQQEPCCPRGAPLILSCGLNKSLQP